MDKLENYVLTWNIRGGAWERDWTEHPGRLRPAVWTTGSRAQLTALNELRARAIAPFSALREALKGENPRIRLRARAV